MSKNPFIGPKSPWIKVYVQEWRVRGNKRADWSYLTRCISRCKDPARAARRISYREGHLIIRINDLDYGAYENACGPIEVREHLAYEHLVYLLQLHWAFYNE